MTLLVQLAELLQARVIDQGGCMTFARTHYLSAPPAAVSGADVIIGLELSDFWATVNAYTDNAMNEGIGTNSTRIKRDTKLVSISSVDLNTKANYQDFQRFQVIDVQMAADAEATLPALIEAVKSAIPNERKAAIGKRGEAAMVRTGPAPELPLRGGKKTERCYHQGGRPGRRLSHPRTRVAGRGADGGPGGPRSETRGIEYPKRAERRIAMDRSPPPVPP